MQQGTRYYFRNSVHNAILNKENWTHFVVERLGKKTIGILHAGEWGHSGRDGDPAAVRNNVEVIKPYLGERLSKRLGRHEIA